MSIADRLLQGARGRKSEGVGQGGGDIFALMTLMQKYGIDSTSDDTAMILPDGTRIRTEGDLYRVFYTTGESDLMSLSTLEQWFAQFSESRTNEKSDETETCKECGDEFAPDELKDGVCEKCREEQEEESRSSVADRLLRLESKKDERASFSNIKSALSSYSPKVDSYGYSSPMLIATNGTVDVEVGLPYEDEGYYVGYAPHDSGDESLWNEFSTEPEAISAALSILRGNTPAGFHL